MSETFIIPPRAPFASDPLQTRGRLYPQAPSATRTAFQRDRDRVIHCTAFRRLKHKTQVFVAHADDYFRTRLTHSLEVAQIARSIARVLGLDEDLAETLALAHDLGHPPFGHAGEDVLDEAMQDYDGFDHNAQTLRIVTKMEHVYPDFDGLNLTWETLEGVVKHNGPMCKSASDRDGLPWAFINFEGWEWLEPHTYAGPEAQVAALADDIAYNNHDIDDGLRAGIITIDQLMELPLVGDTFEEVLSAHPNLSPNRVIREAVRRLIGKWVNDLLEESRKRIKAHNPQSADEVRMLSEPIIGFSDEMMVNINALRAFLLAKMYRHYTVNRTRTKARRAVRELFDVLLNEPDLLENELFAQTDGPRGKATARVVCDHIAGMTDTFAMEEHKRLLSMDSYL
ncbi:MAG: deoxyguanosinetriphosphate triphosphohydrolase [Robiginitomaculum sp.]|nr:MAG: deoxyguanosinetriphosphate triphosphohydrolase [Robiginitomaculum sp.]